ncbi:MULTISPECIES: Mu transposase C-terminal domain-containing protein [unclassified Pseudoalteromonas]|uniref:Mu transposase C-terminal domain-containing protein n=1 Tax=unclassified Pseudoalteromonas TaxID=194690 RepID=UPI0005A605CA|nr:MULTISPECIES: Mu transposase C-terminal domain-containing protein [unclassified Pseudoalteromonas]
MSKDSLEQSGFSDELLNLPQIKHEDASDFRERDLASYPKKIQYEVSKRYDYIKWIESHLIGGWTKKNLMPLINTEPKHNTSTRPYWRTVARWWQSFNKSERDMLSLIPKHAKKGNCNTVSSSDKFYEQAVERYLVKERPSIAKVYQYYSDIIRLENETIVGEKIKALSYKGFYKRIKKLPKYDVMVARYGKYLADMEFQAIYGHRPPTRILERVEIDHTPLDLILLDDELLIPLGRPFLTLLIDSYSRCIVGFHLGFKEPSNYSVLKALLNAIKPKSYIREQFPCIENEWPCHGKFETLVVDNCAEFWSNSLEQSCLEIGINVQYNPVRKPWLKPMVERIFGTINRELLVDIPGKTFSNILKRAEYNSAKDAIMRFSTFNDLLHQWIIDVYHQDKDARARFIPILSWKTGYQQLPPLKASLEDLTKLDIVLGLSEYKQHRRGGIHIHNLRYDSDELSDYRKMYGEKSGETDKYLIKTNPDDLSSVYVYLNKLSQYLKVPCIDPTGYTQKLSLLEHQINLRLQRNYINNSVDLVSLARVRIAINNRIEQEIKVIKKMASKRSVRGGAALAKHQGISSDNSTSIVMEREEVKGEFNTIAEKPSVEDDWNNLISDLKPYS